MYVTVALDVIQGQYTLEADIDRDDIIPFIVGFLKEDIGHGEDPRDLKAKEEYYVSIYKSDNDTYDVEDNCGNRDLRRGILGVFLKDYKDMLKRMEHDDNLSIEELYGFVASG